MKTLIFTILALTFSLTINAQGTSVPSAKPIAIADCGINMDMTHLSGTWFEISRLPNAVDSDLKNVRISFETKNKMVKRSVTGYKDNGRMINVNGKLNYLGCGTYTGIDGGVYMVLSVDEDYQHILMGTPDHKYLWVLSRTSTMDDSEYQELIHKASEMNYDVAGVQLTSHN